jgi:RNA polymerase sigma factor (sigma-70 family)
MDSPWVAIVDDDITAAHGLALMLRGASLTTRIFTSAREFLTQPEASAPVCVVAKLLMAEMSGLELQRQLATREPHTPMVFITASTDVAATVTVMKAGAVSCLQAPVHGSDLVVAVREGISIEMAQRAERAARRQMSALIERLTGREQEVLKLVVAGLPNKQIAFHLGTTEKTIKIHRWRLMRKLRVRRSIDLVWLAAGARVDDAPLEPFGIGS